VACCATTDLLIVVGGLLPAAFDVAALKQRCDAAGQNHLLEDWEKLSGEEQTELAKEIQVRTCAGLPMQQPAGESAMSQRI
jgi:hypothetical protein